MNLPEFITYCILKNLIVTHERLDDEWHANAANKQQLVIENDDWLAEITYVRLANKYEILKSRLIKVMSKYDGPPRDTDLETIIDKFA